MKLKKAMCIKGLLLSAVFLAGSCGSLENVPMSTRSSAPLTETTVTTTAPEVTDTSEESAADTIAVEVFVSQEPESVSEQTGESVPQSGGSVRLLFAGDNLIHTPIYRIAKETAGGDGYDFSPAYANLGTLISDADIAVLNQETILSDDFEPDTYPTFCTPTEMAHDMLDLGFDAFSIANNHVLDKGEKGLLSTLDFWESVYPNVPVYGAYKSEEDMDRVRTLEVNGIKFAFLGYMEHTNGISLPSSSPCRVVYTSEEELIEKQVRHAAEIADCVIVSVHFGIEVSNLITDDQKTFSRKLADWGADIIVGTQPHTIQSMEYLDRADGSRAFVFYCLGNFISTMDNPLSMAEILGRITVEKDSSTGRITLTQPDAVPLVDHFERTYEYVGVYPFDKYTPEMAAKHAISGVSYDFLKQLFRENIPREYMAEEYVPLIYEQNT